MNEIQNLVAIARKFANTTCDHFSYFNFAEDREFHTNIIDAALAVEIMLTHPAVIDRFARIVHNTIEKQLVENNMILDHQILKFDDASVKQHKWCRNIARAMLDSLWNEPLRVGVPHEGEGDGKNG